MLSAPDFEFQFEYKDERTKILNVQHDPENDSNRVKVEKQLGDTGERLKGALLRLERKISAEDGGHTGKIRWGNSGRVDQRRSASFRKGA